jgi:hypothetical protein
MANIKTLNDFYNELKNVGIRLKNQFQMTVTTGDGQLDSIFESLVMYASSVTLPGREQQVAPLAYMGYEFQVPTAMKMTQTLELNIRSDADMAIRNAFLKWAARISNPDILGGSNGQGDKRIPSVGSVRLNLMDAKFENTVCTYLLSGCFPINIGNMEMSNADAGIAEFQVTLQFQFWVIEQESTGRVSDIK